MTPEEDKVINMQFDSIMTALANQDERQRLKDENIMLHLTKLVAQVESNMDMIQLITDNISKDVGRVIHNTEITNGRVLKLETTKNDHVINCPRIKDISDIKNSIEDVTFVQRHPGLFVTLIVASIIMEILALAK